MVEKKLVIRIRPIKRSTVRVKVIGTTDYLPEPMNMDVLDRYDGQKKKKIEAKDERTEAEKVKEKYYYTSDGAKGIPARSFYKAMIRASSFFIEKKDGGMGYLARAVTVKGDILPLEYAGEEVLTHWGRTSGSSGSPRKIMRNAFKNWRTELEIEYNEELMTAEQIFNILNWAGFHVGVGGFRKEKSGNYGMFEVKALGKQGGTSRQYNINMKGLKTRHGTARLGPAWQGEARLGLAGLGKARRGASRSPILYQGQARVNKHDTTGKALHSL